METQQGPGVGLRGVCLVFTCGERLAAGAGLVVVGVVVVVVVGVLGVVVLGIDVVVVVVGAIVVVGCGRGCGCGWGCGCGCCCCYCRRRWCCWWGWALSLFLPLLLPFLFLLRLLFPLPSSIFFVPPCWLNTVEEEADDFVPVRTVAVDSFPQTVHVEAGPCAMPGQETGWQDARAPSKYRGLSNYRYYLGVPYYIYSYYGPYITRLTN